MKSNEKVALSRTKLVVGKFLTNSEFNAYFNQYELRGTSHSFWIIVPSLVIS